MAWQAFVDAADPAAAVVLFVALVWAAGERGRAHREWQRWRRAASQHDPRLSQWCVAVSTVAGCA